jgi:hypothetical protein
LSLGATFAAHCVQDCPRLESSTQGKPAGYGTIVSNVFGGVTGSVRFAAMLRLFPQEENHEEIEQSGNAVAAAALATAAGAQEIHNWKSSGGDVWKNGTNELCWRDASWTPATAAVGCDGAIVAPQWLLLRTLHRSCCSCSSTCS